jgi:uncharacterized OsmC-like protein
MDKYCSVKATLEGSARIDFSYKIVEDRIPEKDILY